jgi:hypothetical protein
MRRWLPWIAGSIVLAALALAAVFIPDPAPFEFLQGRRPLDPSRYISKLGEGRTMFYHFKADYHVVRAAMMAELPRKGFDQIVKLGAGGIEIGVRFTATDRVGRKQGAVYLRRDHRYDLARASFPEGVHQEGWVSVVISGRRELDVFERLRRLIGL